MSATPPTGKDRAGAFVFGLPFLLIGGYFVLAGLGVIPLYSRSLVPLWVIACAGLVFFIPGAVMVVSAFTRDDAAPDGNLNAIRAEEGTNGLLGAWGTGLFMLVLVSTFWGAILSDAPSSGNIPGWMALAIIGLFTLIALASVGMAIYLTLGQLRFGEARLVLSGKPEVGGAVHGYIELPSDNLPTQVRVQLRCLRFEAQVGSASDKKSMASANLKSAWEETIHVPVTVVAGRSRIPVKISVPEGLPASRMPDASTASTWVTPGKTAMYCQWKLLVSADIPGVDLKRTFPVEVIAQPFTESAAAKPELPPDVESDRVVAAAKVALAELAAGRTPAAVAGRLESLGVSDAVVKDVLNNISNDAAQPFAPLVREYLGNLARIQAEMDSGQLMMLDRRRGLSQANTRPRRSLAANAPAPGSLPKSGAPVLLADESALQRGKWILGGFLMVWGGVFGGIPVSIAIMNATQRSGGLFLFFVIGCAAFCGGIWLIARRHSIWLLPGQGRIEERTGVFRADQIQYHDRAEFDRIAVANSVSRSSKGQTTVTFHVALTHGDQRQENSLSLGDYSEHTEALAAAVRLSAPLSFPVYDLTAEGAPRPLNVNTASAIAQSLADPGMPWWRQPSAIVLILANLVPVGGVLFAQWEVFPIMLLFWLENLIVGVITVIKMLTCLRGHIGEKLFTAPFFVIHYGGFCTGHGIFVTSMFGPKDAPGPNMSGFLPDPAAIFQVIQQQGLWIAVMALAASHGFSYFFNFLGRGEYRTAETGKVMMAPYGRIVVLHIVIIFGGFLVMALDSPLFALLMLVILKIIMDVAAHVREHRRKSDAAVLADTANGV